MFVCGQLKKCPWVGQVSLVAFCWDLIILSVAWCWFRIFVWTYLYVSWLQEIFILCLLMTVVVISFVLIALSICLFMIQPSPLYSSISFICFSHITSHIPPYLHLIDCCWFYGNWMKYVQVGWLVVVTKLMGLWW